MRHRQSLKVIAARLAGLRQAMDVVIQGSTPDSAKWVGVNSFARNYCGLANEYTSLTRDTSINIYDMNKLRNPTDIPWSMQKSLFDSIYADVLMLLEMLNLPDDVEPGTVYNLFVSGNEDQWAGQAFQIDISRCVREYTAPSLTNRYGNLDDDSITELKRAPCIFAYEIGHKLASKFGYI